MSIETQEILSICDRLPETQRAEVADFARFLLARTEAATSRETVEQWLATAMGAARPGVTTDSIMAMTRGEE